MVHYWPIIALHHWPFMSHHWVSIIKNFWAAFRTFKWSKLNDRATFFLPLLLRRISHQLRTPVSACDHFESFDWLIFDTISKHYVTFWNADKKRDRARERASEDRSRNEKEKKRRREENGGRRVRISISISYDATPTTTTVGRFFEDEDINVNVESEHGEQQYLPLSEERPPSHTAVSRRRMYEPSNVHFESSSKKWAWRYQSVIGWSLNLLSIIIKTMNVEMGHHFFNDESPSLKQWCNDHCFNERGEGL